MINTKSATKTRRRRRTNYNRLCGGISRLDQLPTYTPCFWRSVILLFVICVGRHQKYQYTSKKEEDQTLWISTEEDRCWMKDAFERGDFLVGSHRSLGDSQFRKQPSCREGLEQLYEHNVHYFDLDLIYDPVTFQLVVAHPMEFQGTTQVYSPCAKQPLETVIQLLDQTMGRSNWSVSLEPKADWERTTDYSILQPPILLLEQILKVVEYSQLEPAQCALIIAASKVQPNEQQLVHQLAQHCSFSLAMRRTQGTEMLPALQEAQQTIIPRYEYLMPTIEFHPSHPNNQATSGVESLHAVQQQVSQKCLYWTVDTIQDLERAAMLRATGIVSNRPLELVQPLLTNDPSWCPQK